MNSSIIALKTWLKRNEILVGVRLASSYIVVIQQHSCSLPSRDLIADSIESVVMVCTEEWPEGFLLNLWTIGSTL